MSVNTSCMCPSLPILLVLEILCSLFLIYIVHNRMIRWVFFASFFMKHMKIKRRMLNFLFWFWLIQGFIFIFVTIIFPNFNFWLMSSNMIKYKLIVWAYLSPMREITVYRLLISLRFALFASVFTWVSSCPEQKFLVLRGWLWSITF